MVQFRFNDFEIPVQGFIYNKIFPACIFSWAVLRGEHWSYGQSPDDPCIVIHKNFIS